MGKHNKKRNTGLIYEFLARTISEAVIENNDNKKNKTFSIIKEHFHKGSQLIKEFRLFNSLLETTVSSPSVADSILKSARLASKQINQEKLDYEKSLLIRSINHNLNESNNFYDKKILNYKTYATIQSLLNEWREEEIKNIVDIALFEEQLKEWLLSDKNCIDNNQKNNSYKDSDPLVEKIMIKKFNEKYGSNLTNEQKDIIRGYIFSNDVIGLISKMKEVREDVLGKIDNYLLGSKGKNPYLEEKLCKARELILKEEIIDGCEDVDDKMVSKFLDISRLGYEIVSSISGVK